MDKSQEGSLTSLPPRCSIFVFPDIDLDGGVAAPYPWPRLPAKLRRAHRDLSTRPAFPLPRRTTPVSAAPAPALGRSQRSTLLSCCGCGSHRPRLGSAPGNALPITMLRLPMLLPGRSCRGRWRRWRGLLCSVPCWLHRQLHLHCMRSKTENPAKVTTTILVIYYLVIYSLYSNNHVNFIYLLYIHGVRNR